MDSDLDNLLEVIYGQPHKFSERVEIGKNEIRQCLMRPSGYG